VSDETLTPVPLALRAMDTLELLGQPDLTDGARAQLLSWPGWGSLAPAFDDNATGAWGGIADRLEALFTPSELAAAAAQVDTSFFSPKSITDAVYTLLRHAGFTGGSVLEPGCGNGRFMASAPAGWSIDWTGVEIDPVSARIARAVNPGAKIIAAPLEKTTFLSGAFDAVVGNVPFSSAHVFDPAYGSAPIHTYFARRALDAVRPGGYVILVTSRFTMDSSNGLDTILDDSDARLVAAVRLPSGTFGGAGTGVVADILAFRKNHSLTSNPGWDNQAENRVRPDRSDPKLRVTEPARPGTSVAPILINAYWGQNPDHVAGDFRLTTFPQNPLIVTATNPEDRIRAAVEAAATQLPLMGPKGQGTPPHQGPVTEDTTGRKEKSFHLIDGAFHVITGGSPVPVKGSAELRALVLLRDAAVTLLEKEGNPDADDDDITPTREKTHTLYTEYVTAFGALNRGVLTEGKPDPESGDPTFSWRRPRLCGFRQDPDYVTVMALEDFDQDTGEAAPATILLRRVNHRVTPVERVDTPADALAVSLGENRGVNLHRIAGLLDLPGTTAALDALGDLVYLDHGRPVAARDYLSGNIRTRLADAKAQAAADRVYQRNVDALEKVLPAPVGALDVKVKLGVPWIPATDIEQFAKDELGSSWTQVSYTAAAALWEADGSMSQAALSQYGTARVTTMRLLEHALNGTSPVVHDDIYRDGRTVKVRNNAETIAAEEKLRLMNDRFSLWVWEDGERAARLLTEYNHRFNSHVARVPDGAYLTFPGLSDQVTPWAHQKNAVDLIISNERALIAHPVGAGKTLSMCLAALTLRRFGLAKKPLIAVPNHLLDQIVREAQQAFPTARLLIASKEDLSGENRRLFAARAATGDWDAIVMTHQAFTSLPVSAETERRWVEQQKFELRDSMDRGDQHSKGAKAVARAMRSLDARLQQLRYGVQDDNTVLFDHLGVDYIMIDESHLFRRLATGTKSRDNGFGSGVSKRATDLLLKIEALAETYPGKPIVSLFTGTPWSNSLAESWVWLRMLMPDTLESAGVKAFDMWVANFINYETNIEVSPDGSGFRMKRRPVGVKNLPELKMMLRQVADIMSADQLGLDLPTARIVQRVVPPTPAQAAFVKTLARRADDIHNGMKEQRTTNTGRTVDDSMLLICNDGRKAAIDPRLVGIDESSSKLAAAGADIARIYHEGADRTYGTSTAKGVFQLCLLDWGTPHPGDAQVYGRLRGLLIRHGIPADRIRFIHDVTTDKNRADLFRACRDGSVSVLIGSTAKVGMGTNIQTRLTALHHIDAPWMPAEVTQREGRAIRPKNLNTEVAIHRYVTEGSFDAFTWATIERKQRAFEALYDPSTTIREAEDISEITLGYGEMKALAAGNPLLLEQAKLSSDVQRLRLLRAVHLQNVNREKAYAKQEHDRARTFEKAATALEKTLAALDSPTDTDQHSIGTVAVRAHKRETGQSWLKEPWRGLNLTVTSGTYDAKRKKVVVELRHDYHTIETVDIVPSLRRQGANAIADHIRTHLDTWADTAPALITTLRNNATRAEHESENATARADSFPFEQQTELDAAATTLAAIERTITAEAMAHTTIPEQQAA